MVFVLPIIKVLIKNFFHHTLGNLNDLKPVFIVSNVDLFSALYSALCLQSSKSWTNTLLVMILPNCAYYVQLAALDQSQLLDSIYDVVINGSLEFTSFLLTNWLLYRQIGVSSGHLLASALEKRQELIQTSLIVSVMYAIQNSCFNLC
ncbi:hypothetical protein Poli38472_011748 [Pythium oligandrum]|uniref:Uncharacterized protein n=1 Tax=Pythium oligandrum TaxID=41045 RepID=A0A8K1C8D6_PYTOL|nr:hypothetical protein Poli38472_011748 [Pythium oligandrum]|eukprot:TMW58160.1 hypothetical protein Poli38472_011748 [Pythium oligandrum]